MEAIELLKANETEINAYLKKREKECLQSIHNESDRYTKIDEYVDKVIHHFSVASIMDLQAYESNMMTKEEFLVKVKEVINKYDLSIQEKEQVLNRYEKYLWSYDVVDELISDPAISDIKLIEPTKVTVKRKGKRSVSNITFRSPEHYNGFIKRVAVRNKVNLSNLNAVQSFTDIHSNSDYRLRFNISTELVNSNGFPSLHIRKIPKYKRAVDELIQDGLFTKEQAAYLIRAVEQGNSMLFCGKGGSGKTTLMNLLLDYCPYNDSVLCIQENDELFSDFHPDIICQNTKENAGEEVQYTLKDLAKNGLLLDIDWFIIGEIKGEEARYLFDASCTGARCMASLHASRANEALVRLADLAKRASDYSQHDILRILSTNFRNVIYMEDYQIKELIEIKGWDEEKQAVEYCFL